VSIRVDPRRLFHWQCVLIGALLVMHLAVGLPALAGHDRLFGARRLFDLRTEANVPTFVSALTLLAAGIAAALLAAAGAGKPRRWVTTWIGVAAVLVFCAVDEAAQIHEHAGSLMRGTLHTTGPFYFAWIVPYGIAAAVGAVLAYPVLGSLGDDSRRCILWGVGLAIMGAIGIEMIQGCLWTARGASVGQTPLNFVLATAEEILELLGGAYLVRGLLTGLAERLGHSVLLLRVGTP
jgi:hypothetical protein